MNNSVSLCTGWLSNLRKYFTLTMRAAEVRCSQHVVSTIMLIRKCEIHKNKWVQRPLLTNQNQSARTKVKKMFVHPTWLQRKRQQKTVELCIGKNTVHPTEQEIIQTSSQITSMKFSRLQKKRDFFVLVFICFDNYGIFYKTFPPS